MNLRDTLPVLALVAVACGGERPAPPPPPAEVAPAAPVPAAAPVAVTQTLLRGIVRLSPTISFRSCDRLGIAQGVDSTSDRLVPAYRMGRATEEEGMYIEVWGYEAGEATVFKDLERANSPSAGGCDQPAPDYQVRAFGIDPVWSVTVSSASVEVAQGDSVRISFPAAALEDSAEYQRLQTSSTAPESHSLRLLLQRRPCSMGRTGTFAAIQATVVLDGVTRTGCAARGRQK